MPHTRYQSSSCNSYFTVLSLLSIFSYQAFAQKACSANLLQTQTIVHSQPVSINTDVLSNTTFYPIPNAPITVTDAPRSYNGVTTLTWTQTVVNAFTTLALTSSNSPSPTGAHDPSPTETSYVMRVWLSYMNGQLSRRQSGVNLLAFNGTVTNDCTQVPVYTISSTGVLTATMGGVTYTYSTTENVAYQQFVPSTIPGDITTSFSTSSNGVLSWMNAAFYNGQASFCTISNGTVYAVFQQAAAPDGCFYIQLSLFSGMDTAYVQMVFLC